jgi:hypothetical protein
MYNIFYGIGYDVGFVISYVGVTIVKLVNFILFPFDKIR